LARADQAKNLGARSARLAGIVRRGAQRDTQREDCAAAVAAIGDGDAATVEFGDQPRNICSWRWRCFSWAAAG